MGDVRIAIHTWVDDQTEEGCWQELRVDGEEVASGRPLDAEDLLDGLFGTGHLDGLVLEHVMEEGRLDG